ncbi:DNA polymerase I [Butyrivibrio sp. XBB1001]|uniref:DNA polymerase I n=1 Tax=Butyrivibrio sp. XBB1001 TaxID=1280682 RepID=UPI0004079B20|nr:DNA polymerase I [Butyrivibrio sp. XBB1001]
MSKTSISVSKYVRDAFYSIPDFTNGDGNHIGGVYGAMFKLVSLLKTGESDEVELITVTSDGSASSDLEIQDTPFVKWQIDFFLSELKNVLAGNITDTDNGFSFTVSDDLVNALSEKLSELSPNGQVKAVPVFSLKMRQTSDLNEVEEIFKNAYEYGTKAIDNYVAFYLLTDSVAPKSGKHHEILGLSICFDENEAVYIPVENFITSDYLGKKLSVLSEKVSLVTFDIKESYRVFEPFEIKDRTYGYEYAEDGTCKDKSYKDKVRCFDTLIGAYLINPNKNDYDPSDVAKEYLGLTLPKKADLFGKKSIRETDEKTICDYACKIAFVCFKTAPLLRSKLSKLGMEDLFYNIEMPLSYILYSMEKEGIIAKADELKAYGDKLQIRITELEKLIFQAAGCEFNINSPKQLGEILFERLGLPAEKKTKSGYSTAADVLEKLAPEYPIVSDILEYRGLTKLKSTYADGLAAFIEEDNRIHTSFNQTITATGRISSTEPNLQNIPMRTELGRLIRKVFVPREGYVFADADYSQVELRILAHMADDKELIAAYHEGKDIHTITASKVFHVPFDEVTPLQRRNAKAVNFGIVYGISSFGLSQDLSISVGEAKEYMEKYFETYPGVKAYQEKVIREAKEKGYSLTIFGRRRPIPELKVSNFNVRQFGERVAMNAPIQGTAADIMKIAMINVFFELKKLSLKSRLILQIHDELVIETAPDEVETVSALLTSQMEKAANLSVPLMAECQIGSDWYEAK